MSFKIMKLNTTGAYFEKYKPDFMTSLFLLNYFLNIKCVFVIKVFIFLFLQNIRFLTAILLQIGRHAQWLLV